MEYTTIPGHMTGRQLLVRPGYPVDFKKGHRCCAARKGWLDEKDDLECHAVEKNRVLVETKKPPRLVGGFSENWICVFLGSVNGPGL
jgi:hypothetical protein